MGTCGDQRSPRATKGSSPPRNRGIPEFLFGPPADRKISAVLTVEHTSERGSQSIGPLFTHEGSHHQNIPSSHRPPSHEVHSDL